MPMKAMVGFYGKLSWTDRHSSENRRSNRPAMGKAEGIRSSALEFVAYSLGFFHGSPILIRPRLGQGAFRVSVTSVYQHRCAVTGERTLPILDAAHIRPYEEGGKHGRWHDNRSQPGARQYHGERSVLRSMLVLGRTSGYLIGNAMSIALEGAGTVE
jgi:hypothetical protein